MFDLLLAAFGLMLVIEGITPLLSPRAWRQVFACVLAMTDGQIRFVGLLSLLGGTLMLAAIWF